MKLPTVQRSMLSETASGIRNFLRDHKAIIFS